jgi:hypothetical protein
LASECNFPSLAHMAFPFHATIHSSRHYYFFIKWMPGRSNYRRLDAPGRHSRPTSSSVMPHVIPAKKSRTGAASSRCFSLRYSLCAF